MNLDSLGLTAGSDYALDLFFAERHTSESHFKIQTSIQEIRTPGTPTPDAGSSALLLTLGVAGIASAGRKLRR